MIRRLAVRVALRWGLPIALAAIGAAPAFALSFPDFCSHATLGKARIQICVPPAWNGDLVVFAHGYVAPTGGDPAIPLDQLELPDGTSIPRIVTGLGFAFATTSYSDDGLAVLPGVQDVTDLVDYFKAENPAPDHVYLVGASEGGLVTTLAVEQAPNVFSGGLATCGPVGDFRRQIDYWGDFRVLFDYFFPGVIPGDVLSVPDDVRKKWETDYVGAITAALTASPARLDKLLRVSRAPFDPNDPESKIETALGILWYNVFATDDARVKLGGGNPYDNSRRLYLGSGNDFWLNLLVNRYYADPRALAEIEDHYQTSGRLEAPLVTLHTTADPIVPYWHEPLYSVKALANSGLLHTNVPVFRYGHCSFRAEEALVALGLLVLKVEGRELLNAERVLPTRPARLRYRSLAKTHGLRR
jgi:pimeloyl-ACP methyl ester carboxylesterase